MLGFVVMTVAAILFGTRFVVRKFAFSTLDLAQTIPLRVETSQVWRRSTLVRSRFSRRYPRLVAFCSNRVFPGRPAGLLLTLTVIGALYLLALFSGLTEDVLEAQGTIHMDDAINAALGSWRTEPFVSVFMWITDLGSSTSVIAAVLIATGFLWSRDRLPVVFSLWLTSFGALATTTVGKLLIGRHRPEFVLDVSAPGWSFPSGHATAAMAVYGFIAYCIARSLPDIRERFEVVYWTAILILLVGFSRVFLGVHYVTDIAGGFMVGGFWLLVGFGIVECSEPSASPARPKALDIAPPDGEDSDR